MVFSSVSRLLWKIQIGNSSIFLALIFAELQDSKTAARYVHMLQLIGPFEQEMTAGFQFLPEKNDGSCDVLGTCPLKEQKLS